MTYTLHYHITAVNYKESSRTTTVAVVDGFTGEVFYGEARRHPNDKHNLALAINLATARAVRKAADSELADEESTIIRHGESSDFYL